MEAYASTIDGILGRVAPSLFCLQGLGQIVAAPLAVCFVCVKGRKEGFTEM